MGSWLFPESLRTFHGTPTSGYFFYIPKSTLGSWYSSATGKLDKWKAKLEEKAAVVQRKSRKLDNIKEFLDEDCVDKCDDGKLFSEAATGGVL